MRRRDFLYKTAAGSAGLAMLAGGTGISSLQEGNLQKDIDEALEMGKKYLVCYWPWMDGGNDPTWDKVNFAVNQLQQIGEKCKESALRFAYHNHHQEFLKLDDQVIYDYILENTDPDLVTMEVDLYWAHKGGFKHLIVEHDRPENEESCARSSIEYLKSLTF